MINRRSFLASLLAGFGTLATWRPAWSQTTLTANVTFVLVNDIYLMADQALADGRRRGGFARLAAVVKQERARRPNVIVAHGGDTLSPSLMSGLDRGAHIITLTNMVAPDIFAVGNHEFDFGKEVFLQRMREATFPLYGANLRAADGSPLPGFKDRAVVTIDGVRIGLTGLAYENSARLSSPEDLRFEPTIDTTKAQAAALRKEGADFVAAVLHCDRGDSLALQYARAADLMLTGHTHDLFISFDGPSAIVESSYDAHYVTAIDVEIKVRERDGKREMKWWPQFRPIDTAGVTPDPEVAALVAQYEAELSRELDVPLGTTAIELDSRTATVRSGEAAIGDLFADAMRIATRSDAALINGGGIRGGKIYAAGSAITRRDILAELPFNNRVIVLELSGRALRQAVEHGLTQLPYTSGRFPQVSGIEATYALARPPGARIISMQVGGKPVDDERLYRVAVLDFLARGGDGYAMLETAKRITPDNDAPLLANEVMSYIRSLGTVASLKEGRLIAR